MGQCIVFVLDSPPYASLSEVDATLAYIWPGLWAQIYYSLLVIKKIESDQFCRTLLSTADIALFPGRFVSNKWLGALLFSGICLGKIAI